MAALKPKSEAELAALVAEAHRAGRKLELRGAGTKTAGETGGEMVDLRALSGIESYEPAELVLKAGAGTRLAEVEALLDGHNQMLAFEPPRFGDGTLGGMIAAGFSGPRRIAAGAVRDHVLGFTAVNGKGEVFKAGGPVVKNVTGYDLPKLVTGSWGSLVALTSVTLKVLPKPRTSLTLAFTGLDAKAACALMAEAMGSAASVSGAAHAPDIESRTYLRLEGFEASVKARAEGLARLLGREPEVLDQAASEALWASFNDLTAPKGKARDLWRVSVPPADGWKAVETLRLTGTIALMDWAGGLIWFSGEGDVEAVAKAAGGHALKLRPGGPTRLEPGVAALSARIKTAFDPGGVFVSARVGGG
ncbi:MAG: glycolate oxidase subunit GlcE [Caulobacteraceae bacterium]